MLTTRTRLKVLSEIAEEGNNGGSPTLVQSGEVDNLDGEELVARRERRRRNIVEELFDTEKTYLHHLEVTHKFFDFPLRFNCLVSEKDHAKLFSNLEQILEVNQKLLEYMEQTTVGTAFKFLGPFLKLYSQYANNHGLASSTLTDHLAKNAEFTKFVQEQEERPEVMGLKLGALLITPVQRIPRYKLLLEDLLENTEPEHHDYQHIKDAAKQIGDIGIHINEDVRRHENFQKMLSIQNSFDSSAPNILEPGREFIKEGPLKKISRRGGKPQDRMFFLFSDMILYGKSRLLDTGNNTYSCCCKLPLRHCQVEAVLGSVQRSDGGGMFRMTCKEESFLLYSPDLEEAKTWMETIEESVRKLNINRQTLRKPSSNLVPERRKSFARLRSKDKKNDLRKKVLTKTKQGSSSNKDPGMEYPSCPSVLSDISIGNCLTPPSKRQRTEYDSESTTGSENVHSPYKDYEKNNEVNLDSWSPGDKGTGCYDDEDSLRSSPNSFMQTTLDDMNNLSGSQQLNQDDLDFCSVANSNRSSVVSSNRSSVAMSNCSSVASSNRSSVASSNSSSSVAMSDSGSEANGRSQSVGGEWDYSSQPWMNPKYMTEDKHSCATWPIRKVIRGGSKVTSGIGGMMDSVRSSKRCSVM